MESRNRHFQELNSNSNEDEEFSDDENNSIGGQQLALQVTIAGKHRTVHRTSNEDQLTMTSPRSVSAVVTKTTRTRVIFSGRKASHNAHSRSGGTQFTDMVEENSPLLEANTQQASGGEKGIAGQSANGAEGRRHNNQKEETTTQGGRRTSSDRSQVPAKRTNDTETRDPATKKKKKKGKSGDAKRRNRAKKMKQAKKNN